MSCILRYGIAADTANLYFVVETYHHIDDYPAAQLYGDIVIDIDWQAEQNTHTTTTVGGDFKSMNCGNIAGTDIVLEWGWKADDGSGADKEYNYGATVPNGAGGYTTNVQKVIPGGVPGTTATWHAAADYEFCNVETGVYEFACPISSITAAITAMPAPYNVTPGSVWGIKLGMWGSIGSSGWDFGYLPGDCNRDNTVDATDLNTVLSRYGQTDVDWSKGDCDGNHASNATDLNTVLSYYGQTNNVVIGGSLIGSTAVPEPPSLVMAATLAALVAAWIVRKRGSLTGGAVISK